MCKECQLRKKLSCQSCTLQLCKKPKSKTLSKISCSGACVIKEHVKTHKGMYCLHCLGEDYGL